MQDHPLLISSIFEHAVSNYGKQEIVSNTVEGGIHRYNYSSWGKRTKKLANALKSLNSDYEAKRYNSTTLNLPKVRVARNGLFHDWLKMKNKLGGQHKIPRLSNSRLFLESLDDFNKNN